MDAAVSGVQEGWGSRLPDRVRSRRGKHWCVADVCNTVATRRSGSGGVAHVSATSDSASLGSNPSPPANSFLIYFRCLGARCDLVCPPGRVASRAVQTRRLPEVHKAPREFRATRMQHATESLFILRCIGLKGAGSWLAYRFNAGQPRDPTTIRVSLPCGAFARRARRSRTLGTSLVGRRALTRARVESCPTPEVRLLQTIR
jgi:hypothetical protein